MKTGTKLQAFTSRANTKQSVYIITHYFNLQHIKMVGTIQSTENLPYNRVFSRAWRHVA